MRLLLVGVTGLVGGHVLEQALADPRVEHVVALARKELPSQPKLQAELVDFADLPEDAAWWKVDAVICTLGTTLERAGSREAFRRVDHDYPLAVARLARRHGTPTYVSNSALGADASSLFFYNRVKGELEQALAGVGFTSLTHVRPGLIGGAREESRPGGRGAIAVVRALGPVLPRRFRLNPAENIARSLLDAAVRARPGIHVVRSDALV